jgi:hypothetical protein
MSFRYKVRRIEIKPLPVGKIQRDSEDEGLTGYINGFAASDIEERFARALSRNEAIDGFTFREAVISGRNLPGQLEVDFIVFVGPQTYVFQLDGEFAHKGISKKQDDARKDALVDEYMRKYGARPVMRIPGNQLENQEDTDRLVRSLIL